MRVAFDEFVFEFNSRQLVRRGEPIHLSPKAFDALAILLQRRPDAVTKEELHARLWPGTFVSDANLSVVMAEVRRALGDEPHSPRFVRTVHKIGYAFCGEAAEGGGPARDGQPRAWLVWNDRVLPLGSGENSIGREPGCAIWLNAAGVSRRHARIAITGDAAILEDLGSTNGTSVNDRRLARPHRLANGDRVRIGPVEMEFRSGEAMPETVRL